MAADRIRESNPPGPIDPRRAGPDRDARRPRKPTAPNQEATAENEASSAIPLGDRLSLHLEPPLENPFERLLEERGFLPRRD